MNIQFWGIRLNQVHNHSWPKLMFKINKVHQTYASFCICFNANLICLMFYGTVQTLVLVENIIIWSMAAGSNIIIYSDYSHDWSCFCLMYYVQMVFNWWNTLLSIIIFVSNEIKTISDIFTLHSHFNLILSLSCAICTYLAQNESNKKYVNIIKPRRYLFVGSSSPKLQSN